MVDKGERGMLLYLWFWSTRKTLYSIAAQALCEEYERERERVVQVFYETK